MVLASFQVEDKLGRARFFRESFLLADNTVQVVLGMSFLTFSNADVSFLEQELTWKYYTVDVGGSTNHQAGGAYQEKGVC